MPGVQHEGGRETAGWGRLGVLGAGVALAGVAAAGYALSRRVRATRERAREAVVDLEHDGRVGSDEGRAQHLVVLGDSSAAGFGLAGPDEGLPRKLAERLVAVTGDPVRITSLATFGATTGDVLSHQVPRLAVTGADLVALVVGVNDAMARRRPARVHEDTCRLLSAVRAAAPGTRIGVLTCPDLGRAPAVPGPLRIPVSIACRWTARAQQRGCDDLGVAWAGIDGDLDPELLGVDGFHPGPGATDLMADELARLLTD